MKTKRAVPSLHELTVIKINVDFSPHGGVQKCLIQEIEDACDAVEDAGPNTVLLIRFSFCNSGEGMMPAFGTTAVNLLSKWEKALRRLECLPAATISMCDGPCFGYGLALMLSTDYRIVSPNLQFTTQDQFGAILPGMVLYRLANQIGVAKARALVLFGTQLGSTEALELGLVNAVARNIEMVADDFIDSLKAVDLSDLSVRRRLLLESPTVSYEEALGVHLAACDRALRN
jgi:isomerase DpgB